MKIRIRSLAIICLVTAVLNMWLAFYYPLNVEALKKIPNPFAFGCAFTDVMVLAVAIFISWSVEPKPVPQSEKEQTT